MIYLDYAATTPVNDAVLKTFSEVTKKFIGNPNSLHKLGIESKELIEASTKQLASLLGVKEKEVIYTSGATESNNTAIIGVAHKYSNRGKHIITTRLEHSSVTATMAYLQDNGYEIDFVDLDDHGLVTIENLEKLIRDDTILVSIGAVNSEIGIIQPIDKIGKYLKNNKKIIFHSDITQAIGKIKINLEDIDLASFSAQKIYGLKGIGCLIKKDHINIEPLIHGGKSTTVYRSGTPATSLIASISKALRLVLEDFNEKYQYVSDLSKYLKNQLETIQEVHLNSNEYCSPYIINISIKNIKSEVMLHALEQENIYISTQTACSTSSTSIAVLALTKNNDYASHSLRISLSHLTTKEEIDIFIEKFKNKLQELNLVHESN